MTAASPATLPTWSSRVSEWLFAATDASRLRVFERALALATLLHCGSLFLHAGEWLTASGFHLAEAERSSAMPRAVSVLSPALVPLFGFALIAATLVILTRPGVRWAQGLLALLLLYTFHLDPVITGSSESLLIIGWLVLATAPPVMTAPDGATTQSLAPVRILQASLILLYLSGGVARCFHGGWLNDWQALWATAQGPTRTVITAWMLRNLPVALWSVLQGAVLLFQLGSPFLFGFRQMRSAALGAAVGYHVFMVLTFAGSWHLAAVAAAYLVLFFDEPKLRVWRAFPSSRSKR